MKLKDFQTKQKDCRLFVRLPVPVHDIIKERIVSEVVSKR
jgi:hypothetical protein